MRSLLLMLLLTSCSNFMQKVDMRKYNTDEGVINGINEFAEDFFYVDSAMVPQNKKDKVNKKIYDKLNEVTSSSYGPLLFKHDLLKIRDSIGDACHLSPFYLELLEKKYSFAQYSTILGSYYQDLNHKIEMSDVIYEEILKNARLRLQYIRETARLLNIDPRYGGLRELEILTKQEKLREEIYPDGAMPKVDFENDMLEVLEKLDKATNIITSLPLFAPTRSQKLLRDYGNKYSPLTRRVEMNHSMVFAIDKREFVRASGKGVVEFAGSYKDLGYSVILNHGDDIKTIYGNLELPLQLKAGDEVELLGRIGLQSNSDLPEFHYRVLINNHPVDPLLFMVTSNRCRYNK